MICEINDTYSQSIQISHYFFDNHHQVKSGNYGIVHRAIDLNSNQIVAIKILQYSCTCQGITPSTLRQITILKALKEHPYIIKLKDCFKQRGLFYLVFDYFNYNLREFLSTRLLTQYTIKHILYQLLDAVSFAHSRRIMHRDITPMNILISNIEQNRKISIKLTDWGLGRFFHLKPTQYTIEVVALHYRAPQILLNYAQYNQIIDIWSIGCIFAELILGKPVFQGNYELQMLQNIFDFIQITPSTLNYVKKSTLSQQFVLNVEQHKGKIDQTIKQLLPSDGRQLLKKMLQIDPQKRISAQQAMKHCYFQSN